MAADFSNPTNIPLFASLQAICKGTFERLDFPESSIKTIITDTRKLVLSSNAAAVFWALGGPNFQGENFVSAAYTLGVRQFVIPSGSIVNLPGKANILKVASPLEALQLLAAWHRKQYKGSLVAITGSNGKTIVKEWLFQLLNARETVYKSPKSYNSQLGVALALCQLQMHARTALIEAGISKPGEMQYHLKMVCPDAVLFTNVGLAHAENFADATSHINEKILLAKKAKVIYACSSQRALWEKLQATYPNKEFINWTDQPDDNAHVQVLKKTAYKGKTTLHLRHNTKLLAIEVPFIDEASLENCMHCVNFALHQNLDIHSLQSEILLLKEVSMRLELKQGINECYVLDDSYSNDLGGLHMALNALNAQPQTLSRTLILSDVAQSGLPPADWCAKVSQWLTDYKINKFIGIGAELLNNKALFREHSASFYEHTSAFLAAFKADKHHKELILLKGARSFRFEQISKVLELKAHGTRLEINLDALIHNLNYFRRQLNPGTKLMVMLKAFAYGAGASEIAAFLSYHQIDYLGLAYIDEGVMLRSQGVSLPMMIMNPAADSFARLYQFQLEPEIYSIAILEKLTMYLQLHPEQHFNIHLKIDTGMHRLGFASDDFDACSSILAAFKDQIKVSSVFSHLAAADDADHDAFTRMQIAAFNNYADKLASQLGYSPTRHILNTSGIKRFPHAQMDMVRLGIGLYGSYSNSNSALLPASRLLTSITQIKTLSASETIGYGRAGKLHKEKRIGTIAIGYADGFSRAFSQGTGKVFVNGQEAPIIGNVCMDMCMIDLDGIPANEGDEVEIFGPNMPVERLATAINTIPYEILTGVRERVKRIFYAEQ